MHKKLIAMLLYLWYNCSYFARARINSTNRIYKNGIKSKIPWTIKSQKSRFRHSSQILIYTMLLRNASILIIDDDTDVLTAVRLLLKTEAKEVVTEKNPENLRWLLSKQLFDLILLDMNFTSSINTGNEGLFWLKKIREFGSEASVIMITAYGDIDLAVRSLKEGAADFVVKPWHNEKLIRTIKEALEKRETGKISSAGATSKDSVIGNELIGDSEVMRDIFLKIEKVAPTDANILILGENGTGKDLI